MEVLVIVVSRLSRGARPFPPAVITGIRRDQIGRCAARHTDITLQAGRCEFHDRP
jgi:hypothetical protein